ncbi:hypothetical protein SFRURICE_006574 [Spodoptera frugiperda]|nr:hypothetical protein SFRURICE_006574 [Spodoptera frugiperda]
MDQIRKRLSSPISSATGEDQDWDPDVIPDVASPATAHPEPATHREGEGEATTVLEPAAATPPGTPETSPPLATPGTSPRAARPVTPHRRRAISPIFSTPQSTLYLKKKKLHTPRNLKKTTKTPNSYNKPTYIQI